MYFNYNVIFNYYFILKTNIIKLFLQKRQVKDHLQKKSAYKYRDMISTLWPSKVYSFITSLHSYFYEKQCSFIFVLHGPHDDYIYEDSLLHKNCMATF